MAQQLRVVVAEPGKPAEVRMIDATLQAFKDIVDGYIEAIPVLGDFTAYINEEGRLEPRKPANRLVARYAQSPFGTGAEWDLLGTFFVVAGPDEYGNDVSLTETQAAWIVSVLNGQRDHGPQLCRPLREDEVEEPRVEVTSWPVD